MKEKNEAQDVEKEDEAQKQLKDKFAIACQVAESRLSVSWNAISSIDTKINAAFGFASGILGLLAGFYSLGNHGFPTLSLVLFGLATLVYILLVILSITAYRVQKWSYRPDIKTLLDHCENENIVSIQEWLANECKTSFDDNLISLNKKGTLANYILVLLAVETILLTAGLIYSIL
jgi:hypothetical protein